MWYGTGVPRWASWVWGLTFPRFMRFMLGLISVSLLVAGGMSVYMACGLYGLALWHSWERDTL